VHPVCRHHDGTAAFGVFIGHIHGAELGDDGTAVFVGQIGVQHPPLRLTTHKQACNGNNDKQNDAQSKLDALALIHVGKALTHGGVYWDSGYILHFIFQCIRTQFSLRVRLIIQPASKNMRLKSTAFTP